MQLRKTTRMTNAGAARLGKSGAFCLIDPSAKISASARIGAHSFIGADVVIEDDVVIEAHVVILGRETLAGADARNPSTRICRGATVQAGAILRPGIIVGAAALISAGAVLRESVPDHAIVSGNPATITGYVRKSGAQATSDITMCATLVSGVRLFQLPMISDIRGHLTVGEFERTIPFAVRRYFMIFGVPSRETRGEHAHRRCIEFLTCVRGSCSVIADDGRSRHEFVLDRPNIGLLLPAMVWRVHHKYSVDASLVVFASEYYDPADYIRTYDNFVAERILHESSLS